MKLKKLVLFSITVMLSFNLLGCSPKNSTNLGNTESKKETKVTNTSKENKQKGITDKEKKQNTNTILSHKKMKEDLDFLVETLENVHPKTYNGFSEEQRNIINTAYEKIKEPLKIGEFYFIANEIVCSFKDAHTSISLNLNGEDTIIDLFPVWLHDGLYVKESIGELQKGDKILSMGGKKTEELFIQLSKVIPAENDNWIKSIGSLNIIKEPYLRYLNIIEDNYVNVKILRKDKKMEVKLPLLAINSSKADQLMDEAFIHEKWVSFTIDNENSLGIFKLDHCNYNDEYKEELNDFFQEVIKNNIQNIAIDLRENTGGNSRVINEFIRYLDVDTYFSYSSEIRYSSEARNQRPLKKSSGYESHSVNKINNRKIGVTEMIFKGNVYAITSPFTFSSANDFAVVFRDNNIGKIIGEPTGNQPSSYGDVLRFKLPNSKFSYQVSFKNWKRPNAANDPENCLTPDIIVYTTIEDIINGSDPQLEKLKEIIKE